MADKGQIHPGLLDCRSLNVNKGLLTSTDQREIEKRIKEQDYYLKLELYSKGFLNVIRNFQALLYYRASQPLKAIELWEESVKCDGKDLNALQDLAKAYNTLRFSSKALSYQGKVRDLQQKHKDSKRRARCKIGQAYAQFCDISATSWTRVKHIHKQVKSFESALQLVDKTTLEDKEYRDWMLHKAKAHEKLCHTYLRTWEYEKYMTSVEETVKLLHETLGMCDTEGQEKYKAEIWTIMGNTFSRRTAKLPPPPTLVQKEYDKQWKDPTLCYTTALALDPMNLWNLGKQGVHHFKHHKYDEALKCFEKCLDEEMASRNESSFYDCRARIYLAKAEEVSAREEKESLQEATENAHQASAHKQKELLQKAKGDALQALKQNYYPRQLCLAGEVYHMLSKNDIVKAEGNDRKNRLEALQRFSQASTTEDGEVNSEVHKKWARCLKDCGDTRAAIESYKVAFEIEVERGSKTRYLPKMTQELLGLMKDNLDQMEEDHQSLLGCREMGFWLLYTTLAFQSKEPDTEQNLAKHEQLVVQCLKKMVSLTITQSLESHTLHKKYMEEFWERSQQLKPQTKTLKEEIMKLKQTTKTHWQEISQSEGSEPDEESSTDIDRTSAYHRPPDHCLTQDRSMQYDFYIINDEKDYEVDNWVQHSLLTSLENPVFALKGYYHPRDSESGCNDIEARSEAIPRCAHLILVISKNFHDGTKILEDIVQRIGETRDIIVLTRKPGKGTPLHKGTCHEIDIKMYTNFPVLIRRLMPASLQE